MLTATYSVLLSEIYSYAHMSCQLFVTEAEPRHHFAKLLHAQITVCEKAKKKDNLGLVLLMPCSMPLDVMHACTSLLGSLKVADSRCLR